MGSDVPLPKAQSDSPRVVSNRVLSKRGRDDPHCIAYRRPRSRALFGLAVPEATATLLGSFFGASIAVTWSLWAASKHRERADRELAHAIAIRLAPITTGLILIIELTRGNNPSPSDEAEFRSLSSELVQSVDDVVGDLIDLHQHLTGIGAANIAQLLELRRNLVQLRQLAQDILGTNVAFAALRSNGLLRHHDEISRAMDWLEVM